MGRLLTRQTVEPDSAPEPIHSALTVQVERKVSSCFSSFPEGHSAQDGGQRVVIPDPWLFCVPVAIGNTKVVKGSEWTRSLGVFGNLLKGEAINNVN